MLQALKNTVGPGYLPFWLVGQRNVSEVAPKKLDKTSNRSIQLERLITGMTENGCKEPCRVTSTHSLFVSSLVSEIQEKKDSITIVMKFQERKVDAE